MRLRIPPTKNRVHLFYKIENADVLGYYPHPQLCRKPMSVIKKLLEQEAARDAFMRKAEEEAQQARVEILKHQADIREKYGCKQAECACNLHVAIGQLLDAGDDVFSRGQESLDVMLIPTGDKWKMDIMEAEWGVIRDELSAAGYIIGEYRKLHHFSMGKIPGVTFSGLRLANGAGFRMPGSRWFTVSLRRYKPAKK